MTTHKFEGKMIRNLIMSHFRSNYSNSLPLQWENMTPRYPPVNGWLRLLVNHERVESVGLNPGRMLHHGRITLTIAVARGGGTLKLDDIAGESVALLADQVINGIRLGAAVFEKPRKEPGFHLLSIEIRFTAFEPDLKEMPS